MKIRIEQKQLADAARHTQRRLPTNPLQPILSALLLDADNDTVTLSGFDLDTSTRTLLDADTLEPGAVVVPGRLLADVAAALPPGPIDLTADNRELTVTAPGTTFSLPTMERRDYPTLPTPPGAAGTADGDQLGAAIGHAAQASMPLKEAVGNMEGFAGVHVEADGDHLVVSASDRYRIVRHTLPWQPAGDGTGELLIPATDIAVTAKQMAGSPVRVCFPAAGGGVAALATDTLTVTSRTIAAPFPNINGFIPDPDKATGWARIDSDELQQAIKRAALVNEKDVQAIHLEFNGDHLVVRGGVEGTKGASQVDAETLGLEDFRIAYRPGFLTSLLAPITGLAQMWFTAPTRPALIAPVDDDTYRAVCMPVNPKQ